MKKIAAIIAAPALTLALTAAPAEAALSDCGNGNICLYDGINYAGAPFWQGSPGYILSLPNDCITFTGANNNRASSIFVNYGFISQSLTLLDGGAQGSRGISTSGYQDANMLTSPGIANFSNVLTVICVNQF